MSESASQIPNLGPFVLLQAMIGVVIVGGAVIAWLRGERKQKRGDIEPSGGVSLFFDGPLNAALNTLQGIYRVIVEIRSDQNEAIKEFRLRHERETEILRDIREDFRREDARREDVRRDRRDRR